jgi:hypothetical protein
VLPHLGLSLILQPLTVPILHALVFERMPLRCRLRCLLLSGVSLMLGELSVRDRQTVSP